MPLKCKLGNLEITLSDIWTDEDAFNSLGSDGIKEMISEDLLSFIDEIKLLDHCEFYWRTT